MTVHPALAKSNIKLNQVYEECPIKDFPFSGYVIATKIIGPWGPDPKLTQVEIIHWANHHTTLVTSWTIEHMQLRLDRKALKEVKNKHTVPNIARLLYG